jgi:iron-sulfur cluster insertion protein
MDIKFTPSAIAKITDILAEENNPGAFLRMFVEGGGCGGMSYGFTIDTEKSEDDWAIPLGASSVQVDAMSAQYLEGASVNYVEELMGNSFKITNPNARTSCGCGSSFSI